MQFLLFKKYKMQLISDFESKIFPHFKNNSIIPITEQVFDFENIADAHRLMESNNNIGKILLKISDEIETNQEL